MQSQITMLKTFIHGLLFLNCIGTAQATPYVPASPDTVLEKLPNNSSVASKEFITLRAKLNTDPQNIGMAVKLAKLYIERSREEGDPRYLGYAQAALGPWWKLAEPPVEILVMRATLLQSTHHFDQSLLDLNAVLRKDRKNGQAWITRSTILQVQGEYAKALQSCEQLYPLATKLITTTCVTNIRNLSGQAEQSYQKLKTAYAESGETNADIQVWVLTLLAEMANRLGDNLAAEKYFQQAIKIEDPDSYLLGSYSDFLLDQHHPQEVIKLLSAKTRIDALLLRYAEALKAANFKEAGIQVDALRQRFSAAMMRGDTVHQREQSRFELRLMKNPIRAMEIAKLNWQVQKEPADARVYLEAAVAANDQPAISAMTHWIEKNHQQDVILEKIMMSYKGKS